MTGAEFKSIRNRLCLSRIGWARALGYQAAPTTCEKMMWRFEGGAREIPPTVAKLAELYDRHGLEVTDHNPEFLTSRSTKATIPPQSCQAPTVDNSSSDIKDMA